MAYICNNTNSAKRVIQTFEMVCMGNYKDLPIESEAMDLTWKADNMLYHIRSRLGMKKRHAL